ncbi:MAG: protein phosphatase 2C domain-containing protein [Saprospiraceae bacterium]
MHEPAVHTVQIAAASHVGQVRQHQEDAFLVGVLGETGWSWEQGGPVETTADGNCLLLAVADGMGGLNAGEVASATAVDMVRQMLSTHGRVAPNEAATVLHQALLSAHFTIEKESAKGQGEMGSTLVIACLIGDLLQVAWVGDSRCYRYRAGEGLRPLTKDHSLVQQMVDEGSITEAEAFLHPKRNVITQSLGIPGHDPEPDQMDTLLQPGDTILLCSDGLNTMLTDGQMAHLLETADGPGQAADLLIEAANAAGGQDNITVVLAAVREQFANVKTTLEAMPTAAPTTIPPNRPKPSQKLIFLMLPLVAILAALAIWSATREQGTQDEELPQAVESDTARETTGDAAEGNFEMEKDSVGAASPTDTMAPAVTAPPTGNFVIQMHTLSTEKSASDAMMGLQKKYPDREIRIQAVDGQYKVLIAGFGNRQEAEDFRNSDEYLKKGFVYLLKGPGDDEAQ